MQQLRAGGSFGSAPCLGRGCSQLARFLCEHSISFPSLQRKSFCSLRAQETPCSTGRGIGDAKIHRFKGTAAAKLPQTPQERAESGASLRGICPPPPPSRLFSAKTGLGWGRSRVCKLVHGQKSHCRAVGLSPLLSWSMVQGLQPAWAAEG